MTKATATQNSGSANILPLSLQGGIDRGLDRLGIGCDPGQALDDARGGVRRDTADTAHGGSARRRDGLLGIGKLASQPLVQGLALGFGLRAQLLASLTADHLRTRTG